MEKSLPPIPAKRYFTIGEVSDLCGVKPYVLRYWEQEFTQLKPMKRRGNRRYYQHHEVLLVRRIRELLYEQGFTISGARNRLTDAVQHKRNGAQPDDAETIGGDGSNRGDGSHDSNDSDDTAQPDGTTLVPGASSQDMPLAEQLSVAQMRHELLSIRSLLAI